MDSDVLASPEKMADGIFRALQTILAPGLAGDVTQEPMPPDRGPAIELQTAIEPEKRALAHAASRISPLLDARLTLRWTVGRQPSP